MRIKNVIKVSLLLLLIGCAEKSIPKDEKITFPLGSIKNKMTSSDTVNYYVADSMRINYKGHSKSLRFANGKDKDSTIEGFRIEKRFIDSLFAKNEGANELYVFFGMRKDNNKDESDDEFTLIFSAVASSSSDPDGIVGKTRLYDYVDPCPSKCPRFKR